MDISFTDRELDMMEILWDRGPSTVAEVREALNEDLAYTSVLTILRILEDKGYIGHAQEGRAHRYHPLVAREAASRSAVRRLTSRMFDGSPQLLATQLVSDRDLSQRDLERLRKLLETRLGEEEGREAKLREREE